MFLLRLQLDGEGKLTLHTGLDQWKCTHLKYIE